MCGGIVDRQQLVCWLRKAAGYSHGARPTCTIRVSTFYAIQHDIRRIVHFTLYRAMYAV